MLERISVKKVAAEIYAICEDVQRTRRMRKLTISNAEFKTHVNRPRVSMEFRNRVIRRLFEMGCRLEQKPTTFAVWLGASDVTRTISYTEVHNPVGPVIPNLPVSMPK